MSAAIELPDWARIKEWRKSHVYGVASLVSSWADRMAVPDAERARWLRAVSLHDAMKDAPEDVLDELAPDWWDIPGLRHGPAAAILAERFGETDQGVLDAVRYHSVGYARWDTVGKVLFLADYLEDGRDFHSEGHRLLSDRVPTAMDAVLQSVTAERISAVLTYGFPLLKETVEFWNGIVSER